MTVKQATAEVFLTAFRALPREAQNTFLFTIIKDAHFREDVIDLVIAVKRSTEKCKNFKTFLKGFKNRKTS